MHKCEQKTIDRCFLILLSIQTLLLILWLLFGVFDIYSISLRAFFINICCLGGIFIVPSLCMFIYYPLHYFKTRETFLESFPFFSLRRNIFYFIFFSIVYIISFFVPKTTQMGGLFESSYYEETYYVLLHDGKTYREYRADVIHDTDEKFLAKSKYYIGKIYLEDGYSIDFFGEVGEPIRPYKAKQLSALNDESYSVILTPKKANNY